MCFIYKKLLHNNVLIVYGYGLTITKISRHNLAKKTLTAKNCSTNTLVNITNTIFFAPPPARITFNRYLPRHIHFDRCHAQSSA